ncbi:MAG: dihydropteroate synthase [bacterium]|nr:dihydropteroate synthase [bacterium]
MRLFNGEIIDLKTKAHIMGILNVTPDSFSDGGEFDQLTLAHRHAEKLVAEGADWIDVGGESTRPGAEPIPVATELERVLPVIRSIRSIPGIRISVDTRNSETARLALQEGAVFVNDVSGGLHDPEMLPMLAKTQSPCCIMHMRGNPSTMRSHSEYSNVVQEVTNELMERVATALSLGIQPEQIVVDPGIGFAKTPEQSFLIISQLKQLCRLGFPVLIGASRKRLLMLVSDAPPRERLGGSIALALIAVQNCAAIVRVHDVAATVQAIRTWEFVKRFAQS